METETILAMFREQRDKVDGLEKAVSRVISTVEKQTEFNNKILDVFVKLTQRIEKLKQDIKIIYNESLKGT